MSSEWSYIISCIYILAWFIAFFVYQNRQKSFNVVSLILFVELALSVISMLLYSSPLSHYNDLKIFPYIYLYTLIMISIVPIAKVPFRNIQAIYKPSDIFINIFCIIFILAACLQIPGTILNFRTGLLTMLFDISLGSEMYSENLSKADMVGDGAISNLPSIITNTFGDIAIFFTLYYISIRKKSRIFLVGLLVSLIVIIIQPISRGLRGPTILRLISIVTAYIILYKFYDVNLNRRIRKALIVAFFVVSIPIIFVTVSRFSEREGGSLHSVVSYLGQANLNFNNYALDANGIRYGDRTANLFKRILVDNVPDNFVERRYKYSNMKITDEVYSTYIGDFVLDYGPFFAPIMIILVSIIFSNLLKIKCTVIPFHKLILIYFISCVMMQGSFYLFPYSDIGGNLSLLAYLLMYTVFWFDYNKRIKRI